MQAPPHPAIERASANPAHVHHGSGHSPCELEAKGQGFLATAAASADSFPARHRLPNQRGADVCECGKLTSIICCSRWTARDASSALCRFRLSCERHCSATSPISPQAGLLLACHAERNAARQTGDAARRETIFVSGSDSAARAHPPRIPAHIRGELSPARRVRVPSAKGARAQHA